MSTNSNSKKKPLCPTEQTLKSMRKVTDMKSSLADRIDKFIEQKKSLWPEDPEGFEKLSPT